MAKLSEPKELLGKTIDDPAVSAFFSSLDPKTKVKRTDLNEPRWISQKAGLEVHAEKKTARIVTVFLYGNGFEGNKQYAHPLPHSLTFTMKKPQVQATFPRRADFTSDEHDAWDFDAYRIIANYGDAGELTDVDLTTDF